MSTPPAAPRVVVIGGGITGLVAAYRLLHGNLEGAARPEVTLLEASDRLGGKICTSEFAGRPVDEGADAFLLRVPWAAELAAELGLASEQLSPAVGGASVLTERSGAPRLSPLPAGLVGGVPTKVGPLFGCPLVGPLGAMRAAADYVLPSRRFDGDTSVGELVRSRLGKAVSDRLADSLLGSISAGSIDRLDAAISTPALVEALSRNRSLMRGLRQMQPAGDGSAAGPIFASFTGGMGRLVGALAERIYEAEGRSEIRLGAEVSQVRRDNGRMTVEAAGERIDADAVIVTAPAHAAAQMLAEAREAAAGLAEISYASVSVLTLAVRAEAISTPAEAGFLVARETGWLVTAASYGSAKWPLWSDGPDGPDGPSDTARHILRVSVGRDDDDRHTRLCDDELRSTALAELSGVPGLEALADPGSVSAWRVSRWPKSLPQYRPGHGRRVERIREALAAEMPGVLVAGAAFGGLGIPACVRQGNEAAQSALGYLSARVAVASA